YYSKGDFEKAISYFTVAFELTQKSEINRIFALNILLLIQALVENNLEHRTEEYLNYLKKSSEELKEYRSARVAYEISKAIILKSQKRLKDISDAKEILLNVIKEAKTTKYLLTFAIIHLCDILILELDFLHSEELFQQIKDMITELLEQAKSQKLFNLLVQLYLLEAQVKLIELDFESSKKFLLKAQKLAEDKGLRQLAIQSSRFHDEIIMKYSGVRKAIDAKKVSFQERIQSSRIKLLIEQIIKRRQADEEVTAEQPVLLLIFDKENELLYSYQFCEDYVESTFINKVREINNSLGEGISLQRFGFNEFNVILNTESSLNFYYIFKGFSYIASLKLEIFIETLKAFQNVWIQLSTGNMNLIQSKGFILNSILNELYEFKERGESSLMIEEPTEERESDTYYNFLNTELPQKLQEFKIILNPVRLALIKILYQNFKMQASELKNLLGISWGAWSSHIQALEKAGIIESKRVFIEQKPRVVISLKSEGSSQYISLKKVLLAI
ncbi:MAG: transcriptional regulator, partial [Candidatus Hodarchaeales archaeon]